jgi:hypothetical protein
MYAAGTKLKGLPAEFLNDLQTMLSQWRANGRRLAPDGASISGGSRGHEILIKNTTSSDIAAFGVLALDQPVIDFTTTANASERFNGIRFKGIAPSTSTPHYGKFCVLQEPALKTNGFARAIVSGLTLAKVSITDSDDGAAEITNSETGFLTTSAWGTARVVWKQSGTGSGKWALLDLGDPILCGVGKANGAIAADATNGNVNVWDAAFTGATGQTLSSCINHTENEIADLGLLSWQVVLPAGKILVAPFKCP